MNNNYEELTVKQLREISRERGLTLESKGHKFTKQELIERLVNDDAEMKEPEKEQDNETWVAPAKEPEVKEQKEEVISGKMVISFLQEHWKKLYRSMVTVKNRAFMIMNLT